MIPATGGLIAGFKRKHSRVDMGRPGRLQRGALSASCKVIDVSESGVRLGSRLFVKKGEVLRLLIELDGGKTLTCELEVVYVRAPKLGARIMVISTEDRERLMHILDDHIQSSFSRG